MTQLEKMRAGREKAAESRRREAIEVVARHRAYDKAQAVVFSLGRFHGYGSPEHVKAKAELREQWPVPAVLPTGAQMRLVYGDSAVESAA